MDTLISLDVFEQYNEEIGNQEEHPLPKNQLNILKMKYGIIPVQLTPSEKYLIQKEERKGL